jgi:rhodanese-related sulfurtransferase
MKRIVVFAVLLIVGLAINLHAQNGLSPERVPRMTIQELKQQLGSPDLIIIDVRSAHDWEDSTIKIKGSVREEASKAAGWIAKYPPTKTIVLHCA